MKKKNDNTNSKRSLITIGGLSALCLAILAGMLIAMKEPEDRFVAAPAEPETSTGTWTENASLVTAVPSVSDSEESVTGNGSEDDPVQILISEDDTGTVTDFSGSVPKEKAPEDAPPEKPVPSGDTTDPDKVPEYDTGTPEIKPTATDPESKSGTDHPGQVYDPVFGWLDGGNTSQDAIDNDKDINKQIGSMGGN